MVVRHEDEPLRTEYTQTLPSRARFEQALGTELGRALRHARPLSLGVLKVEGFYTLCEGRPDLEVGLLLSRLQSVPSPSLRSADLFAHWRGESFVLALPETALAGSCVVGERVRKLMSERSGVRFDLGIAEAEHADTLYGLLARADRACADTRAQRCEDAWTQSVDAAWAASLSELRRFN